MLISDGSLLLEEINPCWKTRDFSYINPAVLHGRGVVLGGLSLARAERSFLKELY